MIFDEFNTIGAAKVTLIKFFEDLKSETLSHVQFTQKEGTRTFNIDATFVEPVVESCPDEQLWSCSLEVISKENTDISSLIHLHIQILKVTLFISGSFVPLERSQLSV